MELSQDTDVIFSRREIKIIEKSSIKGTIENHDFKNHHFIDFGAKDVEFVDCDFSYAVFERSYFYKARFVNCKFLGARFCGCNFRSAKFTRCDFRYAFFSETVIPANEVVNNLPDWHNIRMELLRVLRANAASVGDYRSEKLLIREELSAEGEHLRRARALKDAYYIEKYSSPKKRARTWFRSLLFWTDGLLWGHGENFIAPILFTLFLIATTAGIISFQKYGSSLQSIDQTAKNWANEFLIVLYAFLDVDTATLFADQPTICSLVVIARYVFFGLIISALYRRFAHR
ncbi:hypothetical protein [Azospirillum argentinense]|uniref:pentapeptide repeat-containing protein n=1 Tax=Azospirillum argentinense TaxID=2970906 RepID=UPI0032E03448